MSATIISKKRKHVADGVFYAELNEFFTRELSEEGYSGIEVRTTPNKTEIIIRATHTQEVLGPQGRRIRELTTLVRKRFGLKEEALALYAERVQQRGLSAIAQCESLKYKLLNNLAIRRAAYGVVRYVMESGAKGVEVVVSGKLRAARAKSMKFGAGFMIHSGQPVRDFIDTATRHVQLKQGMLGVKVKIMRDPAAEAKFGSPKSTLPDTVVIHPPKEEAAPTEPSVITYNVEEPEAAAPVAEEPVAAASQTLSRRFKKLTQETSSKDIDNEGDADVDLDDNEDDLDDDEAEDAYNSNTQVETDNENARQRQQALDLYNTEISMHYTNPQLSDTHQLKQMSQKQFSSLTLPKTIAHPVDSATFWSREEKNMPMNEKVQKWLSNVYLPGTLVERKDPVSGAARKRVVNPYPGTSDETASESSSDEAREQRKSRQITRQTIRAYRNERLRQQKQQSQQYQDQEESGGTLDAGGTVWSGSAGGFGARAKRHIRTKAYALACKVIKPPELQTGYSSSSAVIQPETCCALNGACYNNNNSSISWKNHWPGMSTLNYALGGGVRGGIGESSSFLDTSYIAPAPPIVRTSCENSGSGFMMMKEEDKKNTNKASMSLAAQWPLSGIQATAKTGGGSSAYCLPKIKTPLTFYSTELGTHARRQFQATP